MSEAVAGTGPVVVGFNGSPSGDDALTLGQICSRVLGVPLVAAVVHPSPAVISPARVDAEGVADRRRAAEETLDRARERLASMPGPGADAEFRIAASSSAAHGLHDIAEEVGASLLVVGSRSGGPAERLFAGSTAERLLSGSSSPVAVAPAGLHERPPTELGRIGVAYIDTPEARAALALAVQLAHRVSAELRLYTIVAEEADMLPLGIFRDAERVFVAGAREEYRKALEAAIAELPDGVRATGHIVTGEVVESLSERVAEEVDVLFCGSRGYGPVRRVFLGGVSSRLIRRARCPVVVVPRGD
ncbi:MAG TPA: universal stress protein [Pilimelia sp.]|nr:universal stress protein [Pilimelia sp.]